VRAIFGGTYGSLISRFLFVVGNVVERIENYIVCVMKELKKLQVFRETKTELKCLGE